MKHWILGAVFAAYFVVAAALLIKASYRFCRESMKRLRAHFSRAQTAGKERMPIVRKKSEAHSS